MSWRGFGLISPHSQTIEANDPVPTNISKYDVLSPITTTLETPSMAAESLDKRRATNHPAGAKRSGPTVVDQISAILSTMPQPERVTHEERRLDMMNPQGRRLAEFMRDRGGAERARPIQTQRPKLAPKGGAVGGDVTVGGHNMNVGLVVPSMNREHGLPMGWAPRGNEAIEVHSHKIEGIEHNTGLALPGMHREAGLPKGWAVQDAPAPSGANQSSDGVAGAMSAQ